jgi:hypothetical protein
MFKGWTNLRHLAIPPSVQSIDEHAFIDCAHLFDVECDPKWLYFFQKTVTTATIPDDLPVIQARDFDVVRRLMVVKIPENTRVEGHLKRGQKDDGRPQTTTMQDMIDYDPMNFQYQPHVDRILEVIAAGPNTSPIALGVSAIESKLRLDDLHG